MSAHEKQSLLVLRSLWARERRHTDGIERSLEENVEVIAAAGFDGGSTHWHPLPEGRSR